LNGAKIGRHCIIGANTLIAEDPREVTHRIDYQGQSWYIPSYRYGEYQIWGLTAIMIVELVNVVYDAGIEMRRAPAAFIDLSGRSEP
ncbi:hypothetical protein N4Q63_25855, partial [Leclercia adecarboxylata]|nr:hypothetical protein [Leclercia adecarboxylata]